MTSMLSGGRGRRAVRTVVAAGAATLGLAALSACEKPTPVATVVSGTASVSTEAACYGEGDLSEKKVGSCTGEKATETLTVEEGSQLRIGIEPKVAEGGWILMIDGSPVMSEPLNSTYRSFPSEAFFTQQNPMGGPSEKTDSVDLSVAEFDGESVTGIWNVRLKSE